jgi:putative flippase GtrA
LWLEPTREVSLLVLYNGVALVLASLNSYAWNTLWTFRGRAENDARQIVLFALQVLERFAMQMVHMAPLVA